jgi:hypothetical protein
MENLACSLNNLWYKIVSRSVIDEAPFDPLPSVGAALTGATYALLNRAAAAATSTAVAINFGSLTFKSSSDAAAFSSTTKTWTVGDI